MQFRVGIVGFQERCECFEHPLFFCDTNCSSPMECGPACLSQQPMQCLKVLTMSGWNPPPGNRKMHGDLMYLYIVTVEERHVSVTASTRGFYLNQLVCFSNL